MGVTTLDSKTTNQSLGITDETYLLTGRWNVDGIAATVGTTGLDVIVDGSLYAAGNVSLGIYSSAQPFDVLITARAQVWAEYAAVQTAQAFTQITNLGTLVCDPLTDNALYRAAIYARGQTVIENHGVIANLGWRDNANAKYAIYGVGTEGNTVLNTGTISGHVLLGGGDDLFENDGGTVSGTIRGGNGDDTYILDRSGLVLSEAAAGGTDTVQTGVSFKLGDNFENLVLTGAANVNGIGNGLANEITGNAGDNSLRGHAGADRLFWVGGSDTLRGGRGSDTADFSGVSGFGVVVDLNKSGWQDVGSDGGEVKLISIANLEGSDGDDTLTGDDGGNALSGGDGDDVIKGKKGGDVLTGGGGADMLTGSKGTDTFVYNFANESGVAEVDRDTITDFAIGKDQIDLSAIDAIDGGGDDAFTFITTGFTSTAGELRFRKKKGLVEGDTDGDGAADFAIFLDGDPGKLDAGDFIL